MAETKADDRPGVLSALAVRVWLSVAGLASMLAVVRPRPTDYLMSFWVLSYERGYRARALPASALQWLGFDRVSQQLVTAISAVLLLVALALLVELAARAYRNDPGWPTLLLGLLVVGSPVTLQLLALELGSLDHLVVVLTLASLLVLLGDVRWAGLAAVGVMTSLTVLTHEGALLLSLPLVLAAVVARHRSVPWRRLAGEVAVVVVGPALAVAWIQGAPTLRPEEVPARAAVVAEVAEVDPDAPQISWPIVNHTRSLSDNLSYTARRVGDRGHRDHLFAALACAPTLLAAAAVGRQRLGDRSGNGRLRLALWAGVVAAPLLLFPIGHDWGRWLAFSTFNGVVAVVWDSARRRGSVPAPSTYTPMVLMAIALILPSLARDGAFRTRLGNPLQLVRTILGL